MKKRKFNVEDIELVLSALCAVKGTKDNEVGYLLQVLRLSEAGKIRICEGMTITDSSLNAVDK